MDTLAHLACHLRGNVVILGIGNTLQCDDGIGSLLASRIERKTPYLVYDSGSSPENYLGKIIKDKPDTILIVDAGDFGAQPGDLALIEGEELKTTNLFSTHNASLSLTINYLKSNLKVDILVLLIQPKHVGFGDRLTPEIKSVLEKLEKWFLGSV